MALARDLGPGGGGGGWLMKKPRVKNLVALSLEVRVVDPDWFNTDPDPAFLLNRDPDPS
jgi:hypothetical protein